MAELEVGRKAPSFTLQDTDGSKVSLREDVRGHWTVLYFYPKDMTPGCTKQACSIRDHWSTLRRRRVKVFGISPDPVERHRKFTDKHDLPFPLLADEDHAVAERYGVWGEKKLYGRTFMGIRRTSFLVDPEGTIRHIWRKPKVAVHAEEILEVLDEVKR